MLWRRVVVLAVLCSFADVVAESFELNGDVNLEARWYPQSPAFAGQRSSTLGFVVEPTLYGQVGERSHVTFTPLYRYDSADSHRTHGDMREAYLLTFGDWGANSWEVQVGLGRVFWGVAELHNIVDIVNQIDLVEHPRDRPKLGQPMLHVTISGNWGIAEGFILPYHRKRTFPGPSGRLRSRFPISEEASYESSDAERHVDLAVRFSHSVGLLDFGVSAFAGTSREPSFLESQVTDKSAQIGMKFVPYYELIRQIGLDAQYTTELVLYKMEAIQRNGSRDLLGEEASYQAFIFGVEHTQFALFDTGVDLTLIGEWLYDDRGQRATSVWANDLFVAGFLNFNDVQGTELVAGVLSDLNGEYRALNFELKRRVSDTWNLRVESIVNVRSDPEDLTYDGRRDSFLGVGFTYSF